MGLLSLKKSILTFFLINNQRAVIIIITLHISF